MLIETLVLSVDKRIADMLRNLIQRDRNSLLLALHVIDDLIFAGLFVHLIDVGRAGIRQLLNTDGRCVFHIICDIHGRRNGTDCARDGKEQEE